MLNVQIIKPPAQSILKCKFPWLKNGKVIVRIRGKNKQRYITYFNVLCYILHLTGGEENSFLQEKREQL